MTHIMIDYVYYDEHSPGAVCHCVYTGVDYGRCPSGLGVSIGYRLKSTEGNQQIITYHEL